MPIDQYLIRGGTVFDGSGAPPVRADVLIRKGIVEAIGENLSVHEADFEVIEADGKWVMPGFLDTHTHYDCESMVAPGLKESVRHGVTTAFIGSCSISMILSDPEDCSDMFTRVESVPREQVLPVLEEKKTWNSVKTYLDFYDQQPLGPNLAAYLGHSDLRTRVMGLGRATRADTEPTEAEMRAMEQHLEEALEAGLLGLSTMTTPWDKIDGNRFRSAALPSTYARWKEYRRLHRVLRKHRRVLQGAPNIVTKWNTALFFLESMGIFRRKLKTTLITLMDTKADPWASRLIRFATRLVNWFKADFKWQALPTQFELYADGMDLVIFEEFGSGEAALHLSDELQRNALLKERTYRRQFRKDYEKRWGGRVWQRDFHNANIVSCPDASLEGRTFGEVANERGIHPVDLFLDLVVEFGRKLRWHTVLGNHRAGELEKIVKNQDALISFADSGAHIRNMAYYNFPLRLLQLAHQKHSRGENDFSVHHAVHKLTGELADWFGVDAGYPQGETAS